MSFAVFVVYLDIENIYISIWDRYIKAYRIGRLNIDFSMYCHAQFLFLGVDFIFLDSTAGNKRTCYDRCQID